MSEPEIFRADPATYLLIYDTTTNDRIGMLDKAGDFPIPDEGDTFTLKTTQAQSDDESGEFVRDTSSTTTYTVSSIEYEYEYTHFPMEEEFDEATKLVAFVHLWAAPLSQGESAEEERKPAGEE